jgi:sugar lactone lactonase YvrE
MIHDHRICALGEGALWHPLRQQFFWFDILGRKLMSQDASGPLQWSFEAGVSAAGWVSADDLLIAGETSLFSFNLTTGAQSHLADLEADKPQNRSNDGRADPQGGFWIGTMGKKAEKGAGAIYRFHKGELRRLFDRVSIPNAMSFTADGKTAHFADSMERQVWRVALDAEGWPKAEPELFLDFQGGVPEPDGAVVDAAGVLWLAEWGAGRVSAFAPDGSLLRRVELDHAPHSTCPAFGGADLTTLFVTSATQGLSAETLAAEPNSGKTFRFEGIGKGQPEAQVLL